jgi:hypothetical protein
MAPVLALKPAPVPDPADEPLVPLSPGIGAAFDEHQAQALAQQRRHAKLQRLYGALIYLLGIPAGTLAIGAGSTALADSAAWITAGIAFLSAAFTTALTRAAPAEGRETHGKLAADYGAFYRQVRFDRIRLMGRSEAEQLAALRALDKQRYTLDAARPMRRRPRVARPR